MRRPSLSLAVLLALAVPSWADDPAPPGPAPRPPEPTRIVVAGPVEPYHLVRVTVSGDFDSAVFFVEPAELADIEDGKDGRSLVIIGPPGRYTVQVVTIAGKQLGKARAAFTIPDPHPAPVPDPDIEPDKPKPRPPVPPTPPTPQPIPIVSGLLNVSLITDLDMLSPDMTAVRVGLGIHPQEAPLGFKYRTYPVTSPSLDALNLRNQLAAVGTPALIVQDASGRIVSVEKAPTEEAAVIARIKQLRGAN